MGPAPEQRSFRTVPFNGQADAFPAWKLKFRSLMHSMGLRNIMEGKSTLAAARTEEAREEWREKNADLFAQLILALDDENIRRIATAHDDDGAAAWAMLQEHYQGTDELRIDNLRAALLEARCEGVDNVDKFLLEIGDLCSQINWAVRDDREKVTEKQQRQYVMRGLPQEFESFRTTMQLMPDNGYASFEEQLKAFARNRVFNEQRASGMSAGSALYTVRGKQRPNRGAPVVCWNCDKKGHKSFQCPEREDRRGKRAETTMFATAFAAFSQGMISTDGWVVDSGCSMHMCNKACAFERMRPAKQKVIYLADGQTLAVKGQGTVRMEVMTANGTRRPIYLDQVLFVPGLKNNLFSVQKTAEKGHSVRFGRGSAVIKSAGGDVPLKRQGGLFILEPVSAHEELEQEYWLPVPVKRNGNKKDESESSSSSSDEFQDSRTELTPVKVSVGVTASAAKSTWSQVVAEKTKTEQEWKVVTKKRNQSGSNEKKGKSDKTEQMSSPPKTRFGRKLKEPVRFGFT